VRLVRPADAGRAADREVATVTWERLAGVAFALAMLVALVMVVGDADLGETNRVEEQTRYRTCLDRGGSYSTDGVDYACTLPEPPVGP